MSKFIPTADSLSARKAAISHEFDRLIKILVAKRVLRESMLQGLHVIYTEDGPMDINLKRIAPCLKAYPGNCLCWECTNG
jgi:hypothetical protein